MTKLTHEGFDSKVREAPASAAPHTQPMIRTVMNRSDWLTLIGLAVIWGGAFLSQFDVAVNHVHPLTYVWLRADDRGGGDVGVPRARAAVTGPVCRARSGARCLLLALLNNAFPFILSAGAQTHIAERSRLDPQCDHADLGRPRRARLHRRRDASTRARSPACCSDSAASP